MSIIDNKGKLFGKVSIIDLLIVTILLGAVAGAAYKFARSGSASPLSKPDKIAITIYCPETPDFSVTEENLHKGSILKDGSQSVVFGTVTEIKTGPSVGYAPTAQGEFRASSKTGFVSALVTAEGYGTYTENGVIINNVEYSVGQVIERVKAGKSEFRYNNRVYDIKKID